MNKKELALKTRQELLKLARRLNIAYRSRMRKDELVKAIQKAQRANAKKSEAKKKKVKAKAKPKAAKSAKAAPRRSRTARTPRKRPAPKAAGPKRKTTSTALVRPAREPREPPYVDRGQPIPETYTQDKLSALVRDPNWIYVYWELSGPKAKELLDNFGADRLRAAQWILKVHNLTDGSTKEVPILLESYSWYLNVPEDSEIAVELGCYLEDAHYLRVLKAAKVATPRSRPSDKVDDHWAVLDEQFKKMLAYHQLGEYAKPSSPGAGMYSGALTRERS